MKIYSFASCYEHEKTFDEILNRNAFDISNRNIVALLVSNTYSISHCVLIYGCDEKSYKIKDSHGKSYKIPKSRPTSYQAYLTKMASEKAGFENFRDMFNTNLRNEIDLAKVQFINIFNIIYNFTHYINIITMIQILNVSKP